jgi:hypothetical protein
MQHRPVIIASNNTTATRLLLYTLILINGPQTSTLGADHAADRSIHINRQPLTPCTSCRV